MDIIVLDLKYKNRRWKIRRVEKSNQDFQVGNMRGRGLLSDTGHLEGGERLASLAVSGFALSLPFLRVYL
jgi:hypothetical protein